jgi:hypothetical protein
MRKENKGIEMDYGKRERYIFLKNEREYSKMEKFSRWVLFFMALYFLGHIAFALAQPVPSPTQPIIQCWNNGFGTIQCISI